MEANKNIPEINAAARRMAGRLNICVSKVVGKYAAYPNVDENAYQRIHAAVEKGLARKKVSSRLGDFCQELRSVANCHVAELLRPAGADDTDTRIAAIAQVVREYSGLSDDLFRELLTSLLSWERSDKKVILEALVGIIRE